MIRRGEEHAFTFEVDSFTKKIKVNGLYLYELILIMTSTVSHFGASVKSEFDRIDQYLHEQYEKHGKEDFVNHDKGKQQSEEVKQLRRHGYEFVDICFTLPNIFQFRHIYNVINGALGVFSDCVPNGVLYRFPQSRMKAIPCEVGNLEIPPDAADLFKQEVCRLLGFKVSKF